MKPTPGMYPGSYRANDGANDSNVATVTITVTGNNDAPTATIAVGSYAATEQTTLNLHGTKAVGVRK